MITISILKNRLHYCPITGIFTWINSPTNFNLIGKSAGHTTLEGYIEITINDKAYKAHRLAWLYQTGKMPNDQIDHIDGCKSNNIFINLREVTQLENLKNQKIYKNNTSGIVGVNFHKQSGLWRARIGNVLLGYYKDLSEAITIRKQAEKDNNYHKNHGRKG